VWVPHAARGQLGLRKIPINAPWGTSIRLTPLTPVVMFFDPGVMVEVVSRGALELRSSTSLTAAEDAFEAFHGIIPETRYLPFVQFAKARPDEPPMSDKRASRAIGGAWSAGRRRCECAAEEDRRPRAA
jgi:hypothetical protein